MKNLKKLSRLQLQKITGATKVPDDVKCGALLCPDGQQCCYNTNGSYYFCHSSGSSCNS